MRYRLRTLLILLAVLPPLLAVLVATWPLMVLGSEAAVMLADGLSRDPGWLTLADFGHIVGLLIAWGFLGALATWSWRQSAAKSAALGFGVAAHDPKKQ
jgi:hypothetical protein